MQPSDRENPMINRRQFLQGSGLLAAGALANPLRLSGADRIDPSDKVGLVKIASVKTAAIDIKYKTHLVKVTTDSGLYGIGEAFPKAEIADDIALIGEELVGEDPLNVEPLEPNITTLVDFESKWKDMIDTDTPIPTPSSPKYRDKVGVFEGGGYVAKGVYRPMEDCSMKTATVNNFCPVCKRAIQKMIDFYSR